MAFCFLSAHLSTELISLWMMTLRSFPRCCIYLSCSLTIHPQVCLCLPSRLGNNQKITKELHNHLGYPHLSKGIVILDKVHFLLWTKTKPQRFTVNLYDSIVLQVLFGCLLLWIFFQFSEKSQFNSSKRNYALKSAFWVCNPDLLTGNLDLCDYISACNHKVWKLTYDPQLQHDIKKTFCVFSGRF